jgi:hypothetical protein
MQAYRDAGADEISTYGSTPAENAGLIRAWREHSRARDRVIDQRELPVPGNA